MGCHALLQEIFLTQGSNRHPLHFRQILYHWATREACINYSSIFKKKKKLLKYVSHHLNLQWVMIFFCNSNVKDYWSQISITKVTIMKNFEILWELPKYETETQSEQICWKKGTSRLSPYRMAINLQWKKKLVSVKHSKLNHNKTRYTCIPFLFPRDFPFWRDRPYSIAGHRISFWSNMEVLFQLNSIDIYCLLEQGRHLNEEN